MKALLCDPFQRKVHVIEIGEHIADWYKWCDCDLFDHAYLGVYHDQRTDAFVDDEGLLKEPQYPMWHWDNYPNPLVGYGIIAACDSSGNSIPTKLSPEEAEYHIDWEHWELRLKAADYFDQLSRIYMIGSGKSK